MTLEQLRTMRRGGKRPADLTVIIGRQPRHFDDGKDKLVLSGAEPDLSPLIGLAVYVIDLQDDPAVTLRVLVALEAVKVAPLGICGPAGACGSNPQHERAMSLYREALCAT